MSSDTTQTLPLRQTPHLLHYQHLLGVLCWLYPVGYPRINVSCLKKVSGEQKVLVSVDIFITGSARRSRFLYMYIDADDG